MRSQKAFFFAYPTSIKKVLYVTDIPGTSAQGQKHLIEEQQSLWGKESPQCLCPLDHSLQSLQYPGKSTTIKHGMLESEGRGFLCSIKAGFPRAQQSNAGFHYSSGWIQSSIWTAQFFLQEWITLFASDWNLWRIVCDALGIVGFIETKQF